MSLHSKTHGLAPEPTADEIAALFEATDEPPHLVQALAMRGEMIRSFADGTARYRQLLDEALSLLDRYAECDDRHWQDEARRFRGNYAAALSAAPTHPAAAALPTPGEEI